MGGGWTEGEREEVRKAKTRQKEEGEEEEGREGIGTYSEHGFCTIFDLVLDGETLEKGFKL